MSINWIELGAWFLGNLPTWTIAGGAAYLGSYLSMKGKNLATVEDLPTTEGIIQAIRHEFDLKRDQAAHDRSKEAVAAAERLEVCQEAYRLWRELMTRLFRDDVVETVVEFEKFYDEKALYLSG